MSSTATAQKSVAEQEKELNAQLRRAKQTPDRTSASRKDFLKKLIDLAHSSEPGLKKYAASNFKEFFKDFPDLEDDVIDAVYDLCEDGDAQVRMKGYEAISDISAAAARWLKRNVDVLVQLLQTDDRDEVLVVKKALSRHMDLDTCATWGVFIDQVDPPGDPQDDDEREGRMRIRALMLSYLANEARPHIQRHMVRPENEDVLIAGLLRAIESLDVKDIATAKDILLQLPSYKLSSARGHELLNAIFTRINSYMQDNSDTKQLSSDTFSLLLLCQDLAVKRRVAHPYWLLQFYQQRFIRKPLFLELAGEGRLALTVLIANALSASLEAGVEQPPGDGPTVDQLTSLMSEVLDDSAALLTTLAQSQLIEQEQEQAACTLVNACEQRKKATNCVYHSNVLDGLNDLETVLSSISPDKPGSEARTTALAQIKLLLQSHKPQQVNDREHTRERNRNRDRMRDAKLDSKDESSPRASKRRADEPPLGADRGRVQRGHRPSPVPPNGPFQSRRASPPAGPRAHREERHRPSQARTPPDGPRVNSPIPHQSDLRRPRSPPPSGGRSPAPAPTAKDADKPIVPADTPTGPAADRAREVQPHSRAPSRPQTANGSRPSTPLSIVGAASGRKRDPGPNDPPPPSAKRRKGDEPPPRSPALDSGGSLLSRLEGQGRMLERGNRQTSIMDAARRDKPVEEGIRIKGSSATDGASGLSIKGAAASKGTHDHALSAERPEGPARSGSLLARMGAVNEEVKERREDDRRGNGGGRWQDRRGRGNQGQWRR